MSETIPSKTDPQARIKMLCDQATTIQIDPNIPIRRYVRSGFELYKMARNYEEESNYESAFILYMRQITLLLETIRDHPDYSQYPQADMKVPLRNVKDSLPAAERIKGLLLKKYQAEFEERMKYEKFLEQKKKKALEESERKAQKEREQFEEEFNKKCIITSQHEEVALDPVLNEVSYPTGDLMDERSDIHNQIHTQVPPVTGSPRMPTFDRSSKPLSLLSTSQTGKSGMRDIVVPSEMIKKFLKLAQANTTKNIETCGILSGRVSRDQFVITHLIIPQQTGSSDSCTMEHEEELYAQQDKQDVITLGWIHTHPTMTAFLSSVDLHTHCPFQLLMPEALAIVCAPKFNEVGYFQLTPQYGLSFINNCREGGFHPHPNEPPLFQTADHAVTDGARQVTVIDLRR